MDLLTQAAQSIFNDDDEELCIPLTPTKGLLLTPSKGERAAFAELTNTINISPEKFSNSSLQALFNAPTQCTPKTKSRNFINVVNGSRNVGRGSGGKSLSSPNPRSQVGTPKNSRISPSGVNGVASGRSPLTPMTNLKLLTRVASMEESLTTNSKKVLFEKENLPQESFNFHKNVTSIPSSSGPIRRRYYSECLGQSHDVSRSTSVRGVFRKHPTSDNYPAPSSPGNLVLETVGRIPSIDETPATRPLEVSRKDKSLGLLSEKFLEQFPLEVSFLETPRRLVIDEVASMLGTERRRVYDIINVLESLNMATRVQKNMYQWTGRLHLEETLGRLKALGEKNNIAAQLQSLQEDGRTEFKVPQRMKLTRIGDAEKLDSRKEKSLSILCQKFIMILLVSPEPNIISLDNAIRLLVGEVGETGDRLRARGRRLYDIANVLTSLGLVRRIPAAKAFQYIGPSVDAVVNDDDTFGILQRNSLLPSRLASSESKENLVNFGDHEVTPSDVAPPVQKRGRPRKLSTAFTASQPASKRSKLQRTRSEDVMSTQSAKLPRTPSLHDICQVAEVERKKLLKEQQSRRSRSSDGFNAARNSAVKSAPLDQSVKLPNTDFRPIMMSSASSSATIQHRLAKRAKIPVALTFQDTEEYGPSGGNFVSRPTVYEPQNSAIVTHTYRNLNSQKTGATTCHYPEPVRVTMDIKRTQDSPVISPVSIAQPSDAGITIPYQNQKIQEPVIIVRGNTFTNKPYTHSRIVPVASSVSQGAQVIKVITKTSASRQQDASTIMTVLPANPSHADVIAKPKQLVRNSSGCFQQLSEGTYTNGQKIAVTTSNHGSGYSSVKGENATEAKSSSFVVFTVSDSKAGQRTLSKVNSSSGISSSLKPSYSVQRVGPVKSEDSFPSGISALTSAPLKYDNKGDQSLLYSPNGQRENLPSKSIIVRSSSSTWHPSPDGSSTDSELEQIFGDTFSFSRPKALISGSNTFQPNSTTDKS